MLKHDQMNHNHNSLQDIEMSNAILINSSQMMAFGKNESENFVNCVLENLES